MRQLKIYGAGCARCGRLYQNCLEALEAAGEQGIVLKEEDLAKIAAAKVMFTPALEIDGKVVREGKVLAVSQIVELLKQ
jgi:small redox-active disulfide protein 2